MSEENFYFPRVDGGGGEGGGSFVCRLSAGLRLQVPIMAARSRGGPVGAVPRHRQRSSPRTGGEATKKVSGGAIGHLAGVCTLPAALRWVRGRCEEQEGQRRPEPVLPPHPLDVMASILSSSVHIRFLC